MIKSWIEREPIIREFVGREVAASITEFAEYLFGYDDCGHYYATYDDFCNGYEYCCPECGHTLESKDEFEEWDYALDDDGDETNEHVCPICGESFERVYDLEMRPQEVCEYYLVSQFLGEHLLKHGEVILKKWGNWVWGRCASGQAILCDGVMEKICEEIGLFDK